jgi:hypothetical protein
VPGRQSTLTLEAWWQATYIYRNGRTWARYKYRPGPRQLGKTVCLWPDRKACLCEGGGELCSRGGGEGGCKRGGRVEKGRGGGPRAKDTHEGGRKGGGVCWGEREEGRGWP